jgi:hypothetical protein
MFRILLTLLVLLAASTGIAEEKRAPLQKIRDAVARRPAAEGLKSRREARRETRRERRTQRRSRASQQTDLKVPHEEPAKLPPVSICEGGSCQS